MNARPTAMAGPRDDNSAVFKVAESSPRVGLVLKADLRHGYDTGQLAAKVERVEAALQK